MRREGEYGKVGRRGDVGNRIRFRFSEYVKLGKIGETCYLKERLRRRCGSERQK